MPKYMFVRLLTQVVIGAIEARIANVTLFTIRLVDNVTHILLKVTYVNICILKVV